MGPLILSIVIFGVSLYFFIITNNKLKNLRADLLSDEMKREMESLITEFNRTAARNIELIEDRIQALQDAMKKADGKIFQLDDKIERAKKPIVVEKIVREPYEKPRERIKVRETFEEPVEDEVRIRERPVRAAEKSRLPGDFAKVAVRDSEPAVRGKQPAVQPASQPAERDAVYGADDDRGTTFAAAESEPARAAVRTVTAPEDDPMPRSERLKQLLHEGKTKEELVDMGYRENEINLFSFLIGKNL